uniref:Uncharacterized protein n=1 Tax=Sinocyclocheilus grahami TaxID=75366 RepID=A0A672NAB0_SINGR
MSRSPRHWFLRLVPDFGGSPPSSAVNSNVSAILDPSPLVLISRPKISLGVIVYV